MRQEPLLQPGEEDQRELEPLGIVRGHEGHAIRLLAHPIHLRDERHLGQEPGERRIAGGVRIVRRSRDELVQVLPPGARRVRLFLLR